MSATMIDLTLAKLELKQTQASRCGNTVEAHALGLLIEGYKRKVWEVYWGKGEPVFAMPTEIPEDVLEEIKKKSNEINDL